MKFFTITFFTLLFSLSGFAQTYGEIIVPNTFIRKAPNPGSDKLQTLVQGEKVTFGNKEETNGWVYVVSSDGKIKGWITVNTFRTVVSESIRPPISKSTPKPTPQPTPGPPPVPTPTKVPTPIPIPTPTPILSPTPVETTTPVIEAAVLTPTPTVTAVPTPVPVLVPTPPTPTPIPTPTPAPTPEVPVEDKEVLEIVTEEVTLNVRVIDTNNRAVNKLSEKEFQIYEDGELQSITSFITTEVPTINALVIDNSRSLRAQLGKVVEAAKILVSANQSKDESAILRFVSANKIEVVQDFTTNKNSLNNALDNLFIEGGQTAIIDAVHQATKKVEQYQVSQKIEDFKVRAIILVSDGDDRGSSNTEKDLIELLRRSQVQIYAIGFINNLSQEPEPNGISRQEKAKSFLTRLSVETGGKVYFPNSLDELPNIASDISGELRTQYVLTYSPTSENRDGGFRQIKVLVKDGENSEKRNAVTRSGRIASVNRKP